MKIEYIGLYRYRPIRKKAYRLLPDLSSHFLARFKIKLTWIDRRLTFQNIRPDDNVLDEHEIGKTFQLVLTYITVNFLVSFYHRSYVSM